MRLRCRLIRTLAICVAACVSCIVAAAAQSSAPSPASWTLCASFDVRLADQAIEACSAIIAASDNDSAAAATAYGYRGVAFGRRGRGPQDREEALRDLEKAVGPETAIAYAFRGQLHALRQNMDLAIADCDEAIRRDPQLAMAFALRGVVFAAKQDHERAAADYGEAIRIDPTYARAFVGRARANIARSDWSRAIPDLDRALQLDSTSRLAADAFANRANARLAMSDPAGAIADCDAALKLDPRNEQALKIRADAEQALMIYVARGPAGACGEKCEEWLAVEGMVDPQAGKRLIAALDRLGARKLPVVLDFRGAGDLRSAMSIGRILRERGFEATVGQTLVDDCDDSLQTKCMALKRAGDPVQAALVPSKVCGVACVLGLAGGVRRMLPDATTVVIAGMTVGNWFGFHSAEPYREGGHVRTRELVKLHLTQMGVDPQLADMMEENYASTRRFELSRQDIARLRIVTTQ